MAQPEDLNHQQRLRRMAQHLDAGRKRLLVELLETTAREEGNVPSAINDVLLIRWNKSLNRRPIVFSPGILILAQGSVRRYVKNQVSIQMPQHLAVFSLPLPFEAEVDVEPGKPYLAIFVRVNLNALAELFLEMDNKIDASGIEPWSIYTAPLSNNLLDTAIRLLECLQSPSDCRILGHQIVKEIIYRVLSEDEQAMLRLQSLCTQSHFSQIVRVLHKVNYESKLKYSVALMAQDANMSTSSFHRAFKSITASSPLQYQKVLRLHHARMLIARKECNISTAAARVGYESLSQFSREFKRQFGINPSRIHPRTQGGVHFRRKT